MRTFSNDEKAKILKFFNNEFNTNWKTITKYKNYFGFSNNQETLQHMKETFNTVIENELKNKIEKKVKTKLFTELKQYNTKKVLEDIKFYHSKKTNVEEYFKRTPDIRHKEAVDTFTFTSTVGLEKDAIIEYIKTKLFPFIKNTIIKQYTNKAMIQIDIIGKFRHPHNHIEELNILLEKISINAVQLDDTECFTKILNYLYEKLDTYVVFITQKIVIKVIKPIKGGCHTNSNNKRGKHMKLNDLTLFDPFSQNNNCLFKLIEDELKDEFDFKMTKTKCNEIRKEFDIKDNEMIDLDTADKICQKYCRKTVSFIANDMCNTIKGNDDAEIQIFYFDNHFRLLKNQKKFCKDCGTHYIKDPHVCCKSTYNYYNQKVKKNLIMPTPVKPEKNMSKFILHYDIETQHSNIHKEHKPYIVGFCYYDETEKLIYDTLTGDDCMKQFYNLLGTKELNHIKYVNGYNAANFDHYYLFRNDVENTDKKIGNFILNNGALLSAEIQNKKLIDLGRHLTGSLKDNLIGYKCSISKGELDHNLSKRWEDTDEKRRTEVIEYLKCDVMGLCELYEKASLPIYEKYGLNLCNSLTTSSLAYRIWKDVYLKDKIHLPDKTMEVNIRQAIYGGRCYKNKNKFISNQFIDFIKGKIKYEDIFDYIFDADVVSLYPTAMLEKYPIGKEIETNIYQDDKLGIYKIKYTAPKNILTPILPRKQDKKLLWDLKDSEGWYSSVDIENAKEKGYKIEVITGYYWEQSAYIFKDYIEEFYKMKQNATKGTPSYSTAKLFLNALYGKMIQRTINSTDAIISTSEEFWSILNKNIITEINELGEKFLVKYIPKEEIANPLGASKPTQLGVFILAYSRKIMNKHYDKCGNTIDRLPYYFDTDSLNIHSSCLDKIKIDKSLGGIDDDVGGKVIRAIYIAPKMYAFQYVKPDNTVHYHYRGKGVSNDKLTWELFEEMDKGNSKTFYRNFQIKKINVKKSIKDKDNYNYFSHKHIMGENTGKVVNKTAWAGRVFIDNNNSVPYGYDIKNLD